MLYKQKQTSNLGKKGLIHWLRSGQESALLAKLALPGHVLHALRHSLIYKSKCKYCLCLFWQSYWNQIIFFFLSLNFWELYEHWLRDCGSVCVWLVSELFESWLLWYSSEGLQRSQLYFVSYCCMLVCQWENWINEGTELVGLCAQVW